MKGAGLTLARVVALGGEEKAGVVLQDVDLLRQTHPILVGDMVLAGPQPLGEGTGLSFPRRSVRDRLVWDGVGDGG